MKILLTYATNSGATREASQLAAGTLTSAGHSVDLKYVTDTGEADFEGHDCIIMASPSWDYDGKEGMPHEDMIKLLSKLEGKTYKDKPFAVLGLGDSSYTVFCGAATHLEDFVKKVNGKLLVPSLRIDGFYYKPENPDLVKKWAEDLAKKLG